MTQPTPTDYPVYRNILLALLRGVAVLTLAVVFLLAMIVFAIRTPPGAETASRTIAAIMAVVAIVLAWIGIRTIGSRITVNSDGVFVHTVSGAASSFLGQHRGLRPSLGATAQQPVHSLRGGHCGHPEAPVRAAA